MRSRGRELARLAELARMEACPDNLTDTLAELLLSLPFDEKFGPTALLRMIVSERPIPALAALSNEQLGALFKCSATIAQRVKSEALTPRSSPARIGRPTLLSQGDEEELAQWVRDRSSRRDWVSVREFKERVVHILEDQGATNYPSRSFYGDLMERLLGADYEKRSAETVDLARSQVTQQDVNQYFDVLRRESLVDVHPNLIINIDETGFGASSSGRLRATKVIVPRSVDGRLFVGKKSESHYISAIAGITAGGEMLPPALITKRKTMPIGIDNLPIGGETRLYSSEKAFITRKIFQSYLTDIVLPFVNKVREQIGNHDMKAVILMDGHSSHYDQLTGAFAAIHGICLIAIPPHSSHLLQPLDRQFFKKCKQLYAFYTLRKDLDKVLAVILRVMQSLMSSATKPVIVTSWAMAGITPIVVGKEVARVELHPENIVELPDARNIGLQGRTRTTQRMEQLGYGLLNEDEQLFLEANTCPFCMAPLSEDRTESESLGPTSQTPLQITELLMHERTLGQ